MWNEKLGIDFKAVCFGDVKCIEFDMDRSF
jgi:hypothetical protein